MKKLFVLAVTLMLCNLSHAGFLAGMVTGAVLSSNSKSGNWEDTPSLILTSDRHDVISCQESLRRPERCDVRNSDSISIYQYAGQAGYHYILKRGVAFHNGRKFIVMEVGN